MKTKQLLLALFALVASASLWAGPVEEGKTIFMTRCAGCHNVNKTLTGPALGGVDKRHSIGWIVKFVQSSRMLVQSGDREAVAIFQQFNSVSMPDHPDLTADNIKSIVEYIQSAVVVADAKAPFAKPGKLQTLYKPLSLGADGWLFAGFLLVVALLVGVLLLAVHLRKLHPVDAAPGNQGR
ncbi:MAG: cytochrome c [Chitinophagaceae bacterium]